VRNEEFLIYQILSGEYIHTVAKHRCQNGWMFRRPSVIITGPHLVTNDAEMTELHIHVMYLQELNWSLLRLAGISRHK
jgi:hypothetical protein